MSENTLLPPLSLDEFLTKALLPFAEVFAMPCSWISPFTDKINSRLVLVNWGTVIDPKILSAITIAARQMGDDGFFCSFVEENLFHRGRVWMEEAENGGFYYPGLAPSDRRNLRTWFVGADQLNESSNRDFMLSSFVLYSQSARWGAYIHNEDFIIIGGDTEFIAAFATALPDHESLTNELIGHLKHLYPAWHPRLGDGSIIDVLVHAYGKTGTSHLLEPHGLDFST